MGYVNRLEIISCLTRITSVLFADGEHKVKDKYFWGVIAMLGIFALAVITVSIIVYKCIMAGGIRL